MSVNLDFQSWRCCHDDKQFCPPEGCPKDYGCARDHGWKPGDPSPRECQGLPPLKLEPRAGLWHPIGTAPKDGTRLWLYFPHKCEDDRQCVGWWRDDLDGGYWIDHADSNITDPSHWRPLPRPPSP